MAAGDTVLRLRVGSWLPLVFSPGAAAATPSCPEHEHQFINRGRRSSMVVEEASRWALPGKDSLLGSRM